MVKLDNCDICPSPYLLYSFAKFTPLPTKLVQFINFKQIMLFYMVYIYIVLIMGKAVTDLAY